MDSLCRALITPAISSWMEQPCSGVSCLVTVLLIVSWLLGCFHCSSFTMFSELGLGDIHASLEQHTQKSLVLSTVKTCRFLPHREISFSDLAWYISYQSCSCPIIRLQLEFFIKWSWNVILNKTHHHSLGYISHCLSYLKNLKKRGGWTK